jgi:predicted O-methyltransferase YrrM
MMHFLSYKKKAKSAFRLHSPFVFDFYRNVLQDKKSYEDYTLIENLRNLLKRDITQIEITDFGAGSRIFDSNIRKVKDIANTSLKVKKYAQLLYRIAHNYKPETILELGTSLGITTSYLAKGNPTAQITTMEGCPEIAHIATQNFKLLDISNIEVIVGNFDNTLVNYLANNPNLSLVFIDGNHRYEPTLRYLSLLLPYLKNDAFLIFDDIHWSEEMDKAWQDIQTHPEITMTIDLYEIGLAFIRKEKKEKENFILKF